MAATIVPLPEVSQFGNHTVEIWKNNIWVAVPHLRCLVIRRPVQPANGISRAGLEWHYGEIDAGPNVDGLGGFELINPLGSVDSPFPTILHQFVRISWDINQAQRAYWVGVVTAVDEKNKVDHATVPVDFNVVHTGPHVHGTQLIEVSGPEYLLDRKQLLTSEVEAKGTVNRAIPFNMRKVRVSDGSSEQFGNKHFLLDEFTEREDASVWKSSDIIAYLVRFFPSRFIDASPVLLWDIKNEEALDIFTPQFDPHGLTLYQVLAQLVDPRRWTHYVVNYIPNANLGLFGKFELLFNTNTANNIQLPGGTFVAGNPNRATLTTSGTIDGSYSRLEDAQAKYRKVIAQGARRGIVTTVKANSDFLEPGWTAAELLQYENGAEPHAMAAGTWKTNSDGNARGTNDDLNLPIQREFRIVEYGMVFTRFVCANDADFRNDLGGVPHDIILDKQYVPGLRWERWIPLKMRWDYSVNPPKEKNGSGDFQEYKALDSIYLVEKGVVPFADAFGYGSSLGTVIGENSRRKTPSSVVTRPLEDAFGLSIKPRVQPHWQAKSSSTNVTDTDRSITKMFDYKTDIEVTGYFLLDNFAEGQFPEVADISTDANTLVLRLGDVAFDDTLLKGTVVDILAGDKKTAPTTIKIPERDDTKLLKDIASMAFRWYGQTRLAYSFVYKQLTNQVQPGMIADLIEGEISDSLITDVTWDFERGLTAITTGYAEPDFRFVVKEAKLK